MTQHPSPQRRILTTLFAAQVLSGAGLAAGITVGALLAQDILGSTSLSGLPAGLFTIGAAGAALIVGRLSQAHGRRVGLAAGYAAGSLGAAGVVAAAFWDSIVLLFAALLIYGAGTATNLQARYAGADLAPPERRARAMSTVLVATTLGAVVGPNLVTATDAVATSWGFPRLTGPFILAAVAYGLAAVVLQVFLRPDPLLLARARPEPASPAPGPGGLPTPEQGSSTSVRVGVTVMVVTQAVMMAVMSMTPVHMEHHGHATAAAGFVIAVHLASMYLPSLLSGWLVDRYGTGFVSVAAGVVLVVSGLVAGLAPAGSIWALTFALALLGLGWSLGIVAGTTLVSRGAPTADRARVQGNADVFVAVAGAIGAAISGVILAGTSFTALALGGSALSLILLLGARRRRPGRGEGNRGA